MNPIELGNLLAAPQDRYSVLGWIVLLPLLGAIVNGIWGRKIGRQGVYIAGITAVASSFLLSILAFLAMLKTGHAGAEAAEGAHEAVHRAVSFVPTVFGQPWEWIAAPTGTTTTEMIRVRYVVDPLSGIMLLVVTGVGTLIHVYSAGYMSHDKSYARFFAYLNLFIFAMLNLILGDSMVLMFLGWEGVGLASYLLIGFWFENPKYASAGRKAFIVNRIGDAGLILGMSIIAWKGGAYQFDTLRQHIYSNGPFFEALTAKTGFGAFLVDAIPGVASSAALSAKIGAIDFTWGGLAALLLFVGCSGKSAQIPLYVWLPDAMAGPTPVSALIHAATMVTAGIYLLCRMSFFYMAYPAVMSLIALVGAATALFAASIAVTQVELKKVLAYSTVSQLGFMFMGCGVGAFSAGFFHVFTHAFFKACMFLGAGAVMHACRDKQDIRELGGLRHYLPTTFMTFTVSTLAIIGTPGFSGFFSKDEILWRALSNPFAPTVGKLVYFMGVTAALLTSFYMCRLLFLTFFGDGPRFLEQDAKDEHAHDAHAAHDDHGHDAHGADAHGADAHGHDDHGHDDHGHGDPSESGIDMKLMTWPLVVLAALALLAGLLGLPYAWIGHEGVLPLFLEHTVDDAMLHVSQEAVHHAHALEWPAMAGGFLSWIVGAGAAYWVYILQKGEPARKFVETFPRFHQLVFDKWRIDELYDATVVRLTRVGAIIVAGFDRIFIEGIVNGVGALAVFVGRLVKPLQTGVVQVYGAFIGVGAIAIVAWSVFTTQAALTTHTENNQTTVEAAGGPGYMYRWATFPAVENAPPTLDAVCPRAAALEALRNPRLTETSDNHHQAANGQGRQCVAVVARNAFGYSTLSTTVVLPRAEGQ